ncbi:MAG: hypothetical protein KDN20_16925 [Verrucomicrobiae bacterium]|nr:hypothetical protein [Verrucomicrobiae bacterium]
MAFIEQRASRWSDHLNLSGLIAVAILAWSLGVVGCQSPGLVEKSKPVAADPVVRDLLNESRLSEPTRAWLASKGLKQRYREAPEEVVQHLYAELDETSHDAEKLILAELLCDRAAALATAGQIESAMGWYLAVAQITLSSALSPSSTEHGETLLALYNHASGLCGELIFELSHSSSPSSSSSISVPGPLGDYQLSIAPGDDEVVDPSYFDELKVAEYLEIRGYEHREVELGVGGSLVGHRNFRQDQLEKEPFLPDFGMALPVTATLAFDRSDSGHELGGKVELALHDTLVRNTVTLDGIQVNLASDLTAPLALLTTLRPTKNLGVKSMLRPAEYLSKAGIFQLEPYRKDKIPVILVHGLSKTPAVWIPAVNELRADPEIRENFQFLLFRYPSGLPALYCGAMLRHEMARFRNHTEFSDSRGETVLIGKSFGGLVSSLQVRQSGDSLRELFVDRPLAEVPLPESEKEALNHLLHFDSNPDIHRVVFLVTPHQGTDVADKKLATLGSRLIRYPLSLVTDGQVVEVEGMTELARQFVASPPTSVDDLHAHSPILRTVSRLPFSRDLTIHSIVGKVGDGPLSESNDKMVPYWSSHLIEAVSEVVVPCKHGDIAHHPQSVEEIRRILHVHLDEGGTR